MKLRRVLLIYIFSILIVFANEKEELSVYTFYKYNSDYNKLTKEQKNKISKEYQDLLKLSAKVKSKIQHTHIYKIRSNLTIFETWLLQFIKDYKPTLGELKEVYNKNDFKTNPEYKLKTLTVKQGKRLDSIIRQLKAKKVKESRLKLFNIFVKKDSLDTATKDKKGDLGWVKFSNLNPKIKSGIKKLKVNDMLFIKKDNFMEIVYLEDITKPRKATYEEAKIALINIAKKQALAKEIKKLTQ